MRSNTQLKPRRVVTRLSVNHAHLTQRGNFDDLKPSNQEIKVGEGQRIQAEGLGTAVISVEDINGKPIRLQLKECLYVPKMIANILSAGRATEAGAEIVLSNDSGKLTLRNRSIPLRRSGTMYVIDRVLSKCLTLTDQSKGHLWHARLAHPGRRTQAALTGSEPPDKCEICDKHKSKRDPFKKGRTLASEYLQLIHTDLIGPLPITGDKGERHGMIFVDDATRLQHLATFKTKNEAARAFREFTQLYGIPGTVRSDRGGEFTGAEFEEQLLDNWTRHEKTTPDTPQQNSVAERALTEIMLRTRILLDQAKLDGMFWPYAAKMATHIHNATLPEHKPKEWRERSNKTQ